MLRMRFAFLILVAFLLGAAQSARGDVTLLPLATGLASPVDIANAGDGSGRLFIVEQSGRIRIIQNGTLLTTPFLDIQTIVRTGNERGLLGLAFHPRYASNGRFFVFYTSRAFTGIVNGDVVIARYQRAATNPNLADAASGQVLLSVPHSTFDNHNGGALRFGPDGYLYIGVGDGGSGGDPFNSGQDRNSLLGKILRIDVDSAALYAIPPTNPFIGIANVRPEIWAYGVRNPWRFSFDRQTGDFYLGDVGQGDREEVNRIAAGNPGGANFGWKILEGNRCNAPLPSAPNCTPLPAAYVPPIFDYTHAEGASITGGYVYRGLSTPDLAGKYIFGDFSASKIWFSPGNASALYTQLTGTGLSQQVSTFGEGESGELYLANYSTGTVLGFSSSGDTTPDAFAFFAARAVAASSPIISNTVRITGLSASAGIAVTGGAYSIGCTAIFTTSPAMIANNEPVCVRHTSGNGPNASVTTTLTVGGVNVNFTSTTLALIAVQSRKQHGIAGPFDLPIDTAPIAPNLTIEPRAIGSGSGHTVYFQFNSTITGAGNVAVVDGNNVAVDATATASGNDVIVTIPILADNKRITITLTGVMITNDTVNTPPVSMGFLVGDFNNSRSVNASDISALKARSGLPASQTNFKFDVDISGEISTTDVSAVRARTGLVLP